MKAERGAVDMKDFLFDLWFEYFFAIERAIEGCRGWRRVEGRAELGTVSSYSSSSYSSSSSSSVTSSSSYYSESSSL
jgi:hypothetical protein